MQFRIILLISLVMSVSLLSCSSETGTIVTAPLPQVDSQFTPTVVWNKSVGDGVKQFYSDLSPAWDGDIIYTANRKGLIKAFELNNGKTVWSVDLSKRADFFSKNLSALLSGGLTVFGDHIYIGSERGTVIALNKKDGSLIWNIEVSGEAIARPVASNDIVIIHTGNGFLHALDKSSGKIKWTVNLETPLFSIRGESAPSLAYGAAFVGSDNGRVSAILLSQGQLIWQQRISQITSAAAVKRLHDVDITPIIDGDTVYAITYNGILSSLDMRSGEVKWKRDLGSGSVNSIILSGEDLYLVDQNDCVLSIRKIDGTTQWIQKKLLNRGLSSLVMYNGYIVVGDQEGYLHWLSTSTGSFIAQKKLSSSGLKSRPVVAGDKLIVQAKNGTVYLLMS
ncbi:Outer membrane protein assembly factor BamB [Candidatus Hartigia pinicola]|nr:Outer membrane protein assembly factor BamB [Candidatus Hartigia pinicola]